MKEWYFDTYSGDYGTEIFGPYDTFELAMAGIARVKKAGAKDITVRHSGVPYNDSVMPDSGEGDSK